MLVSRKLNIILGQVIEKLYGSNLEQQSATSLSRQLHDVIEIDQRLSEWRASLPTGLEILNRFNIAELDLDSTSESLRFRAIMSLRYHSLNNLLHRKILERVLEHPDLTLLESPGMTEFLLHVVKCSSRNILQLAN